MQKYYGVVLTVIIATCMQTVIFTFIIHRWFANPVLTDLPDVWKQRLVSPFMHHKEQGGHGAHLCSLSLYVCVCGVTC